MQFTLLKLSLVQRQAVSLTIEVNSRSLISSSDKVSPATDEGALTLGPLCEENTSSDRALMSNGWSEQTYLASLNAYRLDCR